MVLTTFTRNKNLLLDRGWHYGCRDIPADVCNNGDICCSDGATLAWRSTAAHEGELQQ